MEIMEGIFGILLNAVLMGVGALAVFFGIFRKGPMFRNPNVKEDCRKIYNNRFSFFLIGAGILMFLAVALDFVPVSDWIRMFGYLLIIIWAGYFSLSTKKYMK